MAANLSDIIINVESRMRTLQEFEYARMTSELWYQRATKIMSTDARREVLTWVLNTAQLHDAGVDGGNMQFEDLAQIYTEIEVRAVNEGLRLRRHQLLDADGGGLNLATEWAAQVSAQAAYWPQKAIASMIANGESVTAYDGKAMFATNHPVHPKDAAKGTFANLITNSTAVLSTSSTADQVMAALTYVRAHIRKIRMPNGVDPRFLVPEAIFAGPELMPTIRKGLGAKFYGAPTSVSDTAAAMDGTGLISALGYGEPIEVPEWIETADAGIYYVLCRQAAASQLGAVVYMEREPFAIRYYSGDAGVGIPDAILDRTNELEWHIEGRNKVAPGHPFLLFKVRAAG